MSQDQPFPDDVDETLTPQQAQVLRRLKQLQPRAVAFDARSVLRAACELNDDRTVDRVEVPHARSLGWVTIGISWACGAVAGALLTFAVLNRPVTADRPSENLANATNDVQPATISTDQSVTRNDEADQSPANDVQGVIPRWSRAEYLISTQLLEQHTRPVATQAGAPLRAGNLLHLHVAAGSPSPTNSMETSPTNRSDSVSTPQIPSQRQDRTSAPINRRQLLEELLGT